MYKVVNGQLYPAPETYRDGKKTITNFDKNKGQQKKYGYKELKEVDVPEYDSETEYVEIVRYEYTEDGEYIVPVYEVKKLADKPVEPKPMPTLEERVLIVEEELTETQIAVAEVFELVEGGV